MERPKSLIPRNSPEIPVVLGGLSLRLTWYNTVIRIYDVPYEDMNHLEIRDGTNKLRMFNCEKPAESLMMRDFPHRVDPEPEDLVVRHYIEMMSNMIPDAMGGEGTE